MNKKLFLTLAVIMSVKVTVFAAPVSAKKSLHRFSDSLYLKPACVWQAPSTIRLYPNPTTNGTIKVRAAIAGEFHFYVFDVQGTLISYKILNDRQTHTINNLHKGVYLYDVFKNDVSIEQGK
ncbi:MAG: T9SS type A sorting domain-containing protein, partial [Flavisolibacter sp.]|nr:T9SS type A sorting domain-containing protein [Flavisolibacter sp.]